MFGAAFRTASRRRTKIIPTRVTGNRPFDAPGATDQQSCCPSRGPRRERGNYDPVVQVDTEGVCRIAVEGLAAESKNSVRIRTNMHAPALSIPTLVVSCPFRPLRVIPLRPVVRSLRRTTAVVRSPLDVVVGADLCANAEYDHDYEKCQRRYRQGVREDGPDRLPPHNVKPFSGRAAPQPPSNAREYTRRRGPLQRRVMQRP